MSEDNSATRQELSQRAWDYFEMHGTQRLTTFNFYIVFSSIVAASLLTPLQSGQATRAGLLPGLLLIFLSFVFWKLDVRNKDLIKAAEAALKYFEQTSNLQDTGDEPHIAKIFLHEEFMTCQRKQKKSVFFWKNHFSYSNSFNIIFACFGLVGLVGVVLAFFPQLRSLF